MTYPSYFRLAVLAMLPAAAHSQLPPACAAFPANCLYTGVTLPIGGFPSAFTYTDVTNNPRTVDVYVRYPIGPVGALPVVIWSPSAEASGPAQQLMSLWSSTTATGGYLSVTLAHPRRTLTLAQRASLCTALKFNKEECVAVNPDNWDWPHDLRQAIAWLQNINASGPAAVQGRIDMSRIAIAGHQDGASGAISLAGALRLITTNDRNAPDIFSDPHPVAFVNLSPQGPNLEGFFDTDKLSALHSWRLISRPLLTLTGRGDNNCDAAGTCNAGDTPSRRRIPYDLMPAGDKFEGFLRTVDISHEFYGTLDSAACVSAGIAPALCGNARMWMQSTVMAFLDAELRGLPLAKLWLQNGLIAPASGGIVEWQSK